MAKITNEQIDRNLASARQEKAVRLALERKFRKAEKIITAACTLAVEECGHRATLELLANAMCALEDNEHHRKMMRSLMNWGKDALARTED